MPKSRQSDLVVVARASSLSEAQVIRAVLQAAGISVFVSGETLAHWLPHMNIALNPRGLEIIVHSRDADSAREVLELGPGSLAEYQDEEPTQESAPERSPDDYAERAYRAAWFTLICTPFFLITTYYYLRALMAKRKRPVENVRRFRWRMLVAFVVGILVPLLILFAIGLAVVPKTDPALVGVPEGAAVPAATP